MVPASAEWPESTETAYGVVRDSAGRPAYVFESPTSQSGDWYLITGHYFDTTGATVLVQRHASFFSGCWDQKGDSMISLRETLISYYGHGLRLAQRDFIRTTFDTSVAAPSDNCNPAFQEPFPVYRSWSSFTTPAPLEPLLPAH